VNAPAGGVWICEQSNGERLRVEDWVYRAWAQGRLNDPMLLRVLNGAVAIYEDGAGRLVRFSETRY
jgi:hypothetical protein